MVYFHSDGALNDYGFQLSFAVVEGTFIDYIILLRVLIKDNGLNIFYLGVPGCGAIYSQESGVITPPSTDGYYLHHLTCEYKIIVSLSYQVKLTFKVFSLEESPSCLFDYTAVSFFFYK